MSEGHIWSLRHKQCVMVSTPFHHQNVSSSIESKLTLIHSWFGSGIKRVLEIRPLNTSYWAFSLSPFPIYVFFFWSLLIAITMVTWCVPFQPTSALTPYGSSLTAALMTIILLLVDTLVVLVDTAWVALWTPIEVSQSIIVAIRSPWCKAAATEKTSTMVARVSS